MSARPHARFNGPGHQRDDRVWYGIDLGVASPGLFPWPTPAERQTTRAHVEAKALALVRAHGELYSLELAHRLECSCGRAKNLLIRLELRGLLASERRQCARSGHGRRYYWLRVEALAAGGTR